MSPRLRIRRAAAEADYQLWRDYVRPLLVILLVVAVLAVGAAVYFDIAAVGSRLVG